VHLQSRVDVERVLAEAEWHLLRDGHGDLGKGRRYVCGSLLLRVVLGHRGQLQATGGDVT